MSEDLIGYDGLTQEAMRTVVRAALARAASPSGLPGRHHFYVSFRSSAPGVSIPDHLLARYPEEMTIVLEHQFWDLEVYADRFRVILKFGGNPYPLTVPFRAVTRFYDPSVRFLLQFEPAIAGELMAPEPAPTALEAPRAAAAPGSGPAGAIVSLDAFRKK